MHGVRRAGAEGASLVDRCRMILERVGDHAFLSHATAALVWGAPLPPWLEQDARVHVAVAAPAARLHSRDLVGHRLDIVEGDVTDWGGLPVTAPARTWFDLAATLELGDLVAVGDYLVHHAAPLTDRVELARVLARGEGHRGIRRARRALELVSERAESRPESLLRVLLAEAGLTPEVNHTLVDSATGRQVRPDLLFRRERLIVEYHGDYHRSKAQWRRDLSRRADLEAQGWRVLELGADDLRDAAALIDRVRALLAAPRPQP